MPQRKMTLVSPTIVDDKKNMAWELSVIKVARTHPLLATHYMLHIWYLQTQSAPYWQCY